MPAPAPADTTADSPVAITDLAVSTADLRAHRVPYLSEYVGVWAMQSDQFHSLCRRAETLNLSLHMQQQEQTNQPAAGPLTRPAQQERDRSYHLLEGGIALIELSGPLMKHRSSFSGGSSTVTARYQIRQAAADSQVTGILLQIDSPGGTVSGTADLAADIAAAAARKPVHAHIDDLCASAAYWLASQCHRITAGATALVGSIGTYAVIQDASQWAANEGIKVHVVRAGEFKGSGIPGTEVTAEQLADMQRTVDALNAHFLAGVSAGRQLSAADTAALADGRVHIAAEARRLKLIDAIGSIDDSLAALQRQTGSRSSRSGSPPAASASAPDPVSEATLPDSSIAASGPAAQESPMSDPVTAPAASSPAAAQPAGSPLPASYSDIVARCPGIDTSQAEDALFVADQLRQNVTADAAGNAWVMTQIARTASARQELEELKASHSQAAAAQTATSNQQQAAPQGHAPPKGAAKGGTGIDPVSDATGSAADHSDPAALFNQLVQDRIKAGHTRAKAVAHVVRNNPDLHQAYIASVN